MTHNAALPDGTVVASKVNPAVSATFLCEIQNMRKRGLSIEQIVVQLRPMTVPPGYICNTWKAGSR